MSTVSRKGNDHGSQICSKGVCLGIERVVSGNVRNTGWSILSTASCRRRDEVEIASVLCTITFT